MSILAAIGSYPYLQLASGIPYLAAYATESTGAVSTSTTVTKGSIVSASAATIATVDSVPAYQLTSGYIDFQQTDYSTAQMPWTAQFWCRPSASGKRLAFIHSQIPGAGDAYANYRIEIPASSTGFRFNSLIGTPTSWFATGVTDNVTRALNQWYHVAVVFSGTAYTMYVNGTQSTTRAWAGGGRSGRHILGVGANIGGYESASNRYSGAIKDFEYYDNIALYTANFTPPARKAV